MELYFMQTGLVSVTFRGLSYTEIIDLVKNAGLDGIEWAGDTHCLPGDKDTAGKITEAMNNSGLESISYGSYYTLREEIDFQDVLDVAVILDVGNIRIWAGVKGSEETDDEERRQLVKDAQRIADMAKVHEIDISFEYHSHTLTDTLESTVQLLNEINKENVYTYFQAPGLSDAENNLHAIKTLIDMKKLKNIHVNEFDGTDRVALADVKDKWVRFISAASPADPALLLEFVKGDIVEQFYSDAKTLVECRNSVM